MKKNQKTLLWISGGLTAAICLVMNLALIPMIEKNTAGLRCFDMNSFGYTFEQAKQFLTLLDDHARSIYLHVQLPLDFFYPVAYTAFWLTSLYRATSGRMAPSRPSRSMTMLFFTVLPAGLTGKSESSGRLKSTDIRAKAGYLAAQTALWYSA